MKNGNMDNNEALELLLDDDFIKIYKKKENKCYTRKDLYELLKKDLEVYEELKEIMGTPIQDIMKRLKVLEILKKSANESGMMDYHFDYYTFLVARNSEDYKLIEDWWWLEND